VGGCLWREGERAMGLSLFFVRARARDGGFLASFVRLGACMQVCLLMVRGSQTL
jgi:hypothetical protein